MPCTGTSKRGLQSLTVLTLLLLSAPSCTRPAGNTQEASPTPLPSALPDALSPQNSATAGVATYPDGKARAFTSVAGNEHIRSGLGAVGGSVDKPSAEAFILDGPDRVSSIPFSRIATIAFLSDTRAYEYSPGNTSEYAQVEVSTKDGKKETFLIWDDNVALHIEWADSIAVSAYEGRSMKGVLLTMKK